MNPTLSKNELAHIWTSICKVPIIDNACITSDSRVLATVSRLDPKVNHKNSSLIDVATGGSVPASTLSSEDSATFSMSPSGLRSIVFRPGRVDVCDKLGVAFSVDTIKAHGKLLTAPIFGSIAWSPSEDCVAYVAEPPSPEVPSFWDDDDQQESSSARGPESKFHWHEDWGEQHIGFSSPSIYVLDISSRRVMPFKPVFDPDDSAGRELADNGDEKGASVGQVSWALGGTHLVFTAWRNGPRRLGIIYCTNRRATVWCAEYNPKASSTAFRCSPDDMFSSVCPRVSPDGTYVVNKLHKLHANIKKKKHLFLFLFLLLLLLLLLFCVMHRLWA